MNGTQRLSVSVSSTSYATHTATFNLPAGTHSVKAAFTNDYRSSSCDRNLILDSVRLVSATTTAPTATPAPAPDLSGTGTTAGKVVFDGDFDGGTKGYEKFPDRIHAERITRVDDPNGVIDPATGAVRKVLRFKVHEGDIGPTENPRAQLQTSQFWGKEPRTSSVIRSCSLPTGPCSTRTLSCPREEPALGVRRMPDPARSASVSAAGLAPCASV